MNLSHFFDGLVILLAAFIAATPPTIAAIAAWRRAKSADAGRSEELDVLQRLIDWTAQRQDRHEERHEERMNRLEEKLDDLRDSQTD